MTADLVQRHYDREGLEDAVLAAFDRHAVDRLSAERVASLDELHCRVRQATTELASLARLRPGMRVLDVGSGLGGPARQLALACDVRVTGLELTPRYVRVARVLTDRAGLSDRVVFEHGNALSASFETESFDCAWLQHVLVNVADKTRLFAELRRVVVPGGRIAVHEVVAPDAHGLRYPLPWARTPATSFVPRPERLRTALESAGFALQVWKDTTPLAEEWCHAMLSDALEDPARFGWRTLLGPDALQMIGNLACSLESGRLGVAMAVFVRQTASPPGRALRLVDQIFREIPGSCISGASRRLAATARADAATPDHILPREPAQERASARQPGGSFQFSVASSQERRL